MSAARDIEQTAAQWLLKTEEPDWTTDSQAELDAWLDESMAHKAAYWRMAHGWREADRISALGLAGASIGDDDTRGAWAGVGARQRRGLNRSRHQVGRGAKLLVGLRARIVQFALAASLVAVVALGVMLTQLQGPQAAPQSRYQTALGVQRTVALADGSSVQLNTKTVLSSAIADDRRDVWLEQGEAFFEVAHDASKPFYVHAGDRLITVVGTKFSVRKDGDKVTVSVLEGHVRISAVDPDVMGGAADMTAGDVAIAADASTLLTRKSEDKVAQSLAWRDGLLRFEQATLSEAAAEFNRYSEKRLVIVGADISGQRIGGTFKASNVDAFVRLLHDAYGYNVVRYGDKIVISD